MNKARFLSCDARHGLAFTLMLAVFFYDTIGGHTMPCMRDTFCEFLPMRLFAAQAWKQGGLGILWNPYNGTGAPFLADPQSGILYPFFVVFHFFSAPTALALTWLFHLWIGGMAFYALGRAWKLDPAPSLLMATCFAFGTWLTGRMEFLSEFATLSWGPVLLLLTTLLVNRCVVLDLPPGRAFARHLHYAVGLAAVFTVQFFAGHPEMFTYTFLLLLVYSPVLCVASRRPGLVPVVLGYYLIAGLLTILLVAPQLLLTLEFLPLSERSLGVDPELRLASLHPAQCVGFLAPFFFGRPGYPDVYWAPSVFEFWVGTCYVGVLPIFLISFHLLGRTSPDEEASGPVCRFLAWLFAGLGAAGLLLAMGAYTPVYQFLYDHLAAYRYFRWPSKLLVFVNYAMVVLAGLGLQRLSAHAGSKKGPLLVLGLMTGAVFLVLWASLGRAATGSGFFTVLAGQDAAVVARAVAAASGDVRTAMVFCALAAGLLGGRILFPGRARELDLLLVTAVFLNLFFVSRQVQPHLDKKLYELQPDETVRQMAGARIYSPYSNCQQWLYGCRDEEVFRRAMRSGFGDCWLPFHIEKPWNGGMKFLRQKECYYLLGQEEIAERVSDLLGNQYVLAGPDINELLRDPESGSFTFEVQARPQPPPRAYCVTDWEAVADPEQLRQRLLDPAVDLFQKAFVETSQLLPAPWNLPTAPAGTVNVAADHDTAVRLDVDVASREPQLLVLNDSWYPGWEALIDQRRAEILRVNYLARGVFVPPGSHRVEFVYNARRFFWGLGLAATGLGIMAIMLVRWLRWRVLAQQ